MPPPLLSVKNLTIRRDDGTGSAIFHDVSFDVNEGDVVIIKGRSGAGKTTLLKCISQLAVYQSGSVLLNGHSPKDTPGGIPAFRTKVLYLPQRPSLLPGTPSMFLETVKSFRSRSSLTPKAEEGKGGGGWLGSFFRSKPAIALDDDAVDGGAEQEEEDVLDPYELSKEWDVNRSLWERSWGDLSGGEGQRIALAIAFARGRGFGQGAEVILLDEPTSALDPETTSKVEQTLLSFLPESSHNPSGGGGGRSGRKGPKAYLLITHNDEQAERLAGKGARVVDLSSGRGTPREDEGEGDQA